jgi:hypothetical protein
MPMNQKQKSPPSDEEILRQLERMLSSPDFHASPKLVSFIKFVVNRALAGKAPEIKDDTVAAEVFGRGPDFDTAIDPVVSIQAGLLRRKLARYFETAGKNDPIRIDIPTGTCVPVFETRLHA